MREAEKCALSSLPTSQHITATREACVVKVTQVVFVAIMVALVPGLAPHALVQQGGSLLARDHGTPLEFLVTLKSRIRTRIQLPIAFAKVMSEEKPPMLWLQVHGCGNGAISVAVEQPGPRLLFLGRGWKRFARAHNLWDGHILRFKMMAQNLLSVKIYGSSSARLGCCEESSSGTDIPSSLESGEDGSDGSDGECVSDPR
ncbi:l-ascorbate oxidase-like protein [Hordeum vulgare]|nr:l-ascorbate oxidase-like protein [Hordeum vulgare]